MAATITLVVPAKIDRTDPCCCASPILQHERISIHTKSVVAGTGYIGNGRITVRGIQYDVDIEMTVAGDQISGHAKFYNRTKRTTLDNALTAQRTSHPTQPIFNEWVGIKLTGLLDTAIIELIDGEITAGGGGEQILVNEISVSK